MFENFDYPRSQHSQVCFVIDAVDTLRTFLAGFAAVTCFTSTAALGACPVTGAAGVNALPLRHVTLQPLPAAVAHAQALAVLPVPAAQHGTRHCGHQRMQVGKQMRGRGKDRRGGRSRGISENQLY